jgi:hypothetical protein
VPEDTALLLGEELWLFRTCGLLSGAWRAGHGGSFIGMTDGGSSRCFEPGLAQRSSDLAWLNEASAFRSDGERRLLVDSAGRVLATLTPGARPSPRPDHAAQFAEPPVVTDELRARFREPAPLPERLEPATVATLRGGWVTAAAADRGNGRGFVEFKDGMTWAGSDGCNGLSGRFAVDARGELLTTHGFSTLIGCDMSPATQWVGQTRRAAFDGETLVLLDVDAHELGRLVRKAS